MLVSFLNISFNTLSSLEENTGTLTTLSKINALFDSDFFSFL